MKCRECRRVLTNGGLDELGRRERRRLFEHVSRCLSCRRRAEASDPTLLFSALPAVEVDDWEIEEVRRTVRALRRVRTLETSRARRVRRAGGAGALAALLLLALVLGPDRPRPETPDRVPFAGAVGLGSGLLRLGEPVENPTSDRRAPVVRNLGRPAARVYQQIEDEVVLVVIVDESIELAD